MSLRKRSALTVALVAANRENARKSTGPRSVEGKRRSRLNALKHGLSAKSFRQAMLGLGENPREYERLHRDLIDSLQPANGLEAKLVEDLAKLWWKKARAERAQAGVQLRDLERLQFERLRELHEVESQRLDENEVREVGLLRARNCAEKFADARSILELLIARVERGTADVHVETALRALYGKDPTWRGATIRSLFEDLRETPQAETVEGSEDDVTPGQGPPASHPAALRAGLLEQLLAEAREVTAEHELFLLEHVEISPATRDARLAPTDQRWTWMLRLDNSLDHQIERKVRILLKLQSSRTKGPSSSKRTSLRRRCSDKRKKRC